MHRSGKAGSSFRIPEISLFPAFISVLTSLDTRNQPLLKPFQETYFQANTLVGRFVSSIILKILAV